MNGGNVLVANTVNMTVSDPIIELGLNNIGTNDLGIIMTRPAANSNVAVVFDESDDILRMGYTLNGASDSIVDLDSNALAVSVQGALSAGSNLEVGTANLFVDTTTSNVGVGVSSPAYKLDVGGDINIASGSNLRIGGSIPVFSNWTANGSDIYRSSGNVGIGTDSPHTIFHTQSNVGANNAWVDQWKHVFDANWNFRFSQQHNIGSSVPFGFKQRWNGGEYSPITFRGSTMELSGNVGIGTASPAAKFDVRGASHDPSIPTVHIGDNTADAGDYGMVNLVRDATSGGSKAHLAFIRNGNTVTAMGFHNNTNTFGIWTSFGGVTTTPRLSIDTAGNVGIGTASPSQILHLLGQGTGSGPKIRFETLNNGNGDYTVDGTEIGGIQFAADDLTWATQHTSSEIVGIHRNPNYSGAQGDLVFKTSSSQGSNPTEKMRINHDGNVGIGLTNPTYDLDVRGGLAVSYVDNNAMKIDGGGTLRRHYIHASTNYGAGLHFTSDGIWPTNYAGTYVNNQIDLGHSNYKWKGVHTEYLACGGSGGVPATFTSSAAWQTAVNIANSTVPNNTWSFLLGGSGNNTGAAGVGSLGFYVNNGTGFVMNLNANGNVGIGTTNPGVPLDIKTTGNYNGIGLLGSSSGRYTLSTNGNGTELIMSHGSYSFGLWRNAHHYDVYSGSNFSGSRDFYLNYYSGANVRLSGGTVVTSDDRIKTEERYIENATETLLKLKPQIYLKGPNIGSTSNVSRIESGLIAQDVYYDAPELRHLVSLADDAEPTETKPYTDDDPQNDPDYSSWGSKSAGLEYEGLIAYLIKSNQELYTEIQAEKEKTATLETQVAALLERVTALENA
jgi:hypothetical protein